MVTNGLCTLDHQFSNALAIEHVGVYALKSNLLACHK